MPRKRNILNHLASPPIEIVWQGRTMYVASVPINQLRDMDINPTGRVDENTPKIRAMAKNMLGFDPKSKKGTNHRPFPTEPLYVFPVIDIEGKVIDGHGRIKVHKLGGIDTIPCIIHTDINPTKAFFTINNKSVNKSLSYQDLISAISRGLDLEELPPKMQRDYRHIVDLLGKKFVNENLITEKKKGKNPSLFAVNRALREFASEKWFNSDDRELMFKCYHWLFVLKNSEAMRAIGGFKSGYRPAKNEKELITRSIMNGGKLVKSEETGKWTSLDPDSDKVKELIRKHNQG